MKTVSLRCPVRLSFLLPATAVLVSLSTAPQLRADSGTWTNPAATGLWSDAANWLTGTIADGSGFGADFNTLDLTADKTVQLDGPRELSTLTFGDTDPTTPANWFVSDNLDPLNILTLSGVPTINVNALGTGATATISAAISGVAGLTKTGTGQLNLTGANTYVGVTNVNGGILNVGTGGSINAGAFNTSPTAGCRLIVGGGSLTSSAVSTFNQTGLGFLLSSGAASFNGGLRTANADGSRIQIDGGNFTATTLELRRTQSYTALLTTTDAQTTGLYVNGGNATIGTLNAGTSNSSVSARIDSGSLTVTGNVNLGNTSNTRFSILQVKGGSFVSSDPLNGVVLGVNTTTGNPTELYLTGGVSTVEKVSMGASSLVTAGSGTIYLNGGTLYLGSGGIEKRAVGTYAPTLSLIAGTLGAKADWATDVNANTGNVVTNNATIKAADASDAPFNIRLNGVISGSGGFTKTGAGTLILNGNNTYDNTGGLGTVITAGTLQIGAGGTTGSLGVGPITNNASLVFNRSDATTLAETITGTGTLTKQGSGALTLTADNTLDSTTVASGSLLLANATGSATGAGTVTVQSGATLGGTGTASGTVTVNSGGQIAPGASVGTLNTGNLTLNAGSNLHYEFNGTPANDQIRVTGTLTLNGGALRLRQENTVNPWSSLAKYYLIKYDTLAGTGVAALTVANPVSGVNYAFGTETVGAEQFITVTLTSAGTPNTWNVDSAGTWSSAANWSTGVPGGVGNPVNFLSAIAAPRTITLDSPRTAGSLTFDNGNSYTLAGSPLTLDNGASAATATSLNGIHSINPNVVLTTAGLNTLSSLADAALAFGGVVSGPGAIRHSGPGILRLTGTNLYSGGTTLANNGTIEITSGTALGTGVLAWNSNGTLRALDNFTLTQDATIATGVNGTIDTATADVTVSSILSGPGILVKEGSGRLILTNTNTYAGGTSLMEGEISFASLANLGSGGLTFDGGSLLWAAGNTTDISARSVTLAAGGGTLDTGANNVTLTAPIGASGPGSLTKAGTGSLTLPATAENTYSGPTLVLAGTLSAAVPLNLGPAPAVFTAGQLTLDGGTFAMADSFELPATTGVAVGSSTGTISIPATFALGIPGGISDRDATPGILNLTGEGTVSLTTNSTFSGGGDFKALTVNANATNALGSGVITLDGTTVNLPAGVTLPNGFNVNSTATINLTNSNTGAILAGPFTGSGVLTINTAGVRSGVSGDWTNFTGDLNVAGDGEWRLTTGNESLNQAKVNIMGATQLVLAINPNAGVPRVIRIGQLTGTGFLGGQPVAGRFVNWVVGGLGTSSTYEGVIKDNMSQPNGVGNAASQFTKEGTGTLTLTGNSTYTSTTTVNNGTLLINGDNSLATGAVSVNGGTLGGSGTTGGPVTILAGATLAPGTSIGTFTTASALIDGTLLTEYDNTNATPVDKLTVNGDLTLGASSALVLQSLGAFPGSSPQVIATFTGTLAGQFATVTGLPAGFVIDYAYNDGVSSNNIAIVPSTFPSAAYAAWVTTNSLAGADADAGSDPDKDGIINLLEFALDGNPNSAADLAKTRVAVITQGADQIFTFTVPVRTGAVFAGATSQTATLDGVTYTVQGTDDLTDWSTMITSEVTPTDATGMPTLNAGWTYRTFRTPGAVSADQRDYLRVKVSS